MTYSEWRRHYHEGSCRDSHGTLAARLCNLEGETRVAAVITRVQSLLGRAFRRQRAKGLPAADAALTAMDRLRKRLATSKVQRPTGLFGLIPAVPRAAIPPALVTFTTARTVRRYLVSGGPTDDVPDTFNRSPSPPVRLTRPFKIDRSGAVTDRTIWFTFETPSARLGDDPTEVVRALGLAHIKRGRLLYRLDYRAAPATLFVPTALDANLYEAWAPPPPAHVDPWGLTRDTRDGTARFPEVVAFVADCAAILPTARLVSPRGKSKRVGQVTPDFTVGRVL